MKKIRFASLSMAFILMLLPFAALTSAADEPEKMFDNVKSFDIVAFDTKVDGKGVYVYTNDGDTDRILLTKDYNFGNTNIFIFDGDGMMNRIRAEYDRPVSAPAHQPGGGEWVCPSCGSKTIGAKFCDNCGALKTVPVEADAARTSVNETWACPSCGSEGQSKKFCENCGCARPAPKTVRCASCGYTPENQAKPPKFCPECGKPLS